MSEVVRLTEKLNIEYAKTFVEQHSKSNLERIRIFFLSKRLLDKNTNTPDWSSDKPLNKI